MQRLCCFIKEHRTMPTHVFLLPKHLSPLQHSALGVQSMKEDNSHAANLGKQGITEIVLLFLQINAAQGTFMPTVSLSGLLWVFCSSQETRSSLINRQKKIPSVYYPVVLPAQHSTICNDEGLLRLELPSNTTSNKTPKEQLAS